MQIDPPKPAAKNVYQEGTPFEAGCPKERIEERIEKPASFFHATISLTIFR
jgi:hypothetical protein